MKGSSSSSSTCGSRCQKGGGVVTSHTHTLPLARCPEFSTTLIIISTLKDFASIAEAKAGQAAQELLSHKQRQSQQYTSIMQPLNSMARTPPRTRFGYISASSTSSWPSRVVFAVVIAVRAFEPTLPIKTCQVRPVDDCPIHVLKNTTIRPAYACLQIKAEQN